MGIFKTIKQTVTSSKSKEVGRREDIIKSVREKGTDTTQEMIAKKKRAKKLSSRVIRIKHPSKSSKQSKHVAKNIGKGISKTVDVLGKMGERMNEQQIKQTVSKGKGISPINRMEELSMMGFETSSISSKKPSSKRTPKKTTSKRTPKKTTSKRTSKKTTRDFESELAKYM